MNNYYFKTKSITTYLIVINVIVFIIEFFLGGSTSNNIINQLFTMYTPSVLSGQVWRLFTSMFLHFGLTHILMNMMALYSIGYFLEEYIGTKKYLLIYLLGGICGNLGVIVSDMITGSSAMGAGASGAIFAILGAILYIAKFEPQSHLDYKNVIFSVIFALAPGFIISGISLSAHIGGLIGGIIIYMILSKTKIYN